MKTWNSGATLTKHVSRKARRPIKAYSNYIYKLKKASPAVIDTVAVPGWLRAGLRAELCARVGTEAARLAKFNRRGTITQREVCAAVRATPVSNTALETCYTDYYTSNRRRGGDTGFITDAQSNQSDVRAPRVGGDNGFFSANGVPQNESRKRLEIGGYARHYFGRHLICLSGLKMQFMLLFSRQGKLRLQKWYVPLSDKEKKKITRELVQTVLARKPKMCSFLEWRDLKIVYKRYASLYFCCAIEDQDNELITLEIIHRYVELLDKYFGSVCELDIIFNFEKAYFILDEFLLGGEAQETSKKNVLKAIEQADLLQEPRHEYFNVPVY
ncbi:hypothetical protein AMELA_G00200060 [Ameiurus melas]|uniref:AP-1 complex subunit sigma-2 n=13 Tax=Actinopteri TaxID=186623 RepID=A0A7J6A944_AMEME|nr:hypothetical protein AMELA_G00200060 [Ameiurus melas]